MNTKSPSATVAPIPPEGEFRADAGHVIPPAGPALIPRGFTMPPSDAGLANEPSLDDLPPAVLPEIASLAQNSDSILTGPPHTNPADAPPNRRPYISPLGNGAD